MKRPALRAVVLVCLLSWAAHAATTNDNDDTCDVGLFPAATLLLPYFEVSLGSSDQTTIFAVTNTGAAPQAARVTLWTDYSYPVISFDLFLTGYDVEKVNLSDVINRGLIGPESSPLGPLSDDDNDRLEEDSCSDLPHVLPSVVIQRLGRAFTGNVDRGDPCRNAGGVHMNAVGYATIDLVGACTGSMPIEPDYFTHEIRFDNVLVGDYVQVAGEQNFAQGDPMVHIRAIPEGGEAATRKKTNLPRTFYSRLETAATRGIDARQPLPATFAARWISGGPTGFETFFKIWRESAATARTDCSQLPNASLRTYEAVRFDEDENPEAQAPEPLIIPVPEHISLPSTSLTDVTDNGYYPESSMGAVAGWMYLNLNHYGRNDSAIVQNWVVVSMRAEKRFSADIDATALGNGCSPIAKLSMLNDGTGVIGPAPNGN